MQHSATTDRTLVMSRGKRFESARPLFISAYLSGILSIRAAPSSLFGAFRHHSQIHQVNRAQQVKVRDHPQISVSAPHWAPNITPLHRTSRPLIPLATYSGEASSYSRAYFTACSGSARMVTSLLHSFIRLTWISVGLDTLWHQDPSVGVASRARGYT